MTSTSKLFEVTEGSALPTALDQRESGAIEAAIETLLGAAGQSLADANVALTLAKMLAEAGHVHRAAPWFRHALKLAPDDVLVRAGYGAFLGQTGRVAEARAVLGGARAELKAQLAAAGPDGQESLEWLVGFVASTEVNLARAALETGDTAFARQLVAPWLASAEHWPFAHGVFAEIVERDALDPKALAEAGLGSGCVSPYMVCYLLEQLVDAEPVDFTTLERTLARADECLTFDWQHAAPEIEGVLSQSRALFGHAVMRGGVDAALCPALTALATPTPRTPERLPLVSPSSRRGRPARPDP